MSNAMEQGPTFTGVCFARSCSLPRAFHCTFTDPRGLSLTFTPAAYPPTFTPATFTPAAYAAHPAWLAARLVVRIFIYSIRIIVNFVYYNEWILC